MEKKRILILGAGVSGLSAGWHLAKKFPHYECTLLEKSQNPGGWMHSENVGDFLVEGGPRVFKTSRNLDFLELIQELNFSSSLIPSSKSAKARYLWTNGRLQKMPGGPLSLCFSTLGRSVLAALWKEKNIPPVLHDETVWDFAMRRFGKDVAERLIDPLVLGIYAGDSKTLSVESCFPFLKTLEKEYGSILKGMFSSLKKKKQKSSFKGALFSFKQGTRSFVEEWSSKFPFPIHYGEEVVSLKRDKDVWQAKTLNKTWEADAVILAVPSFAAAQLLKEESFQASQLLESIPYEDITTLHLGWKGDVLPVSAFGYLVPTKEKEPILGVLFDTKMFDKKDTLITVMVRGVFYSEEELGKIAKKVAESHLQILKKPDLFSYKKMGKAIPQYVLGHLKKKEQILNALTSETQSVYLVGNYLEGVSVNDCVKNAKKMVERI